VDTYGFLPKRKSEFVLIAKVHTGIERRNNMAIGILLFLLFLIFEVFFSAD